MEGLTQYHSFDSLESRPQQLAFQSNNRLVVRYDPGLELPSGELRERRVDPNAIVRVLDVPGYGTAGSLSANPIGRWQRGPAARSMDGPNELFAFQCRDRNRTMLQIEDGLDGSRLNGLDENAGLVYQSAEGVNLDAVRFSDNGRYMYGL